VEYAPAVAGDPRFAAEGVRWEFVLVGRNLDGLVEEKRSEPNRDYGIIHQRPNLRVWAWTWGELLHACRHRLKFIRERLAYDPAADEAFTYLRRTYPDCLPPDLVVVAGGGNRQDEEPTSDRAL
jgi:hypothetical protein